MVDWATYNDLVRRDQVLLDFDVVDRWDLELSQMNFGKVFINPIHPHAGYVLSAPSVLKPEVLLAPYYSAYIPFVASSVILRTLGAVPFTAAYEVNAQLGQPDIINNLATAQNLTTTNHTK
jgi:hypothetical protein